MKTLGEARVYGEAEKKPKKDGTPSKFEREVLGEMKIGAQKLGVSKHGTNNRFLYKSAGYVCHADGDIVSICTSRVPFLIALFALVAAIAIAATVLVGLILDGTIRPVIKPDNPLPPIEDNIVPDTEEGEKEHSPEGGGSVSMIYTLVANIDLSEASAEIYFRNPVMSNHAVVVEFYIVSDGNEYLAATSGLIPAGNALYELELSKDAPVLSEGVYEGLYRVSYYDPVTGVRAHVQSDITGVSVTAVE